MSGATDIPVSTLSKIEHGRLTLSFDKVQDLSHKLGISMSELFSGDVAKQPIPTVTGRRSIARQSDALNVRTENYDYNYLCTEIRNKKMIPLIAHIVARTLDEFGPLVRHDGEEFVYVIDGEIVVHTEFYDSVRLKVGEGIYIDSNMGHAYLIADGCKSATVLGVCASDEDEHAEFYQNHCG